MVNVARPGPVLGGVAYTIARRYDVDVLYVRLAFALLALLWGLGAIAYISLRLMLPPVDTRAEPTVAAQFRANASRLRDELGATGGPSRRSLSFVFLIAGAAILGASLGILTWLTPIRVVGLAVMAAGAVMLVHQPTER